MVSAILLFYWWWVSCHGYIPLSPHLAFPDNHFLFCQFSCLCVHVCVCACFFQLNSYKMQKQIQRKNIDWENTSAWYIVSAAWFTNLTEHRLELELISIQKTPIGNILLSCLSAQPAIGKHQIIHFQPCCLFKLSKCWNCMLKTPWQRMNCAVFTPVQV